MAAMLRMASSEWGLNASFSRNLPGGGDGDGRAFERTRTGAPANYSILRVGASFIHAFASEWQSRIAFSSQYTQDSLIPGEQFGIGGMDSVRGYLPREASNDTGYSTQLEMYTPNLADKAGLSDKWKSRLVGFYDFGQVRRNNTLPGEQDGKYLASTGIGLRLTQGKTLSVRFDLAQILRAHGTRQLDDLRLSGSIAVVY